MIGLGEVFVITILAAIVVLFGAGMVSAINSDSRLMSECIADGKKEYECRSMLRGGQTRVMPVVIPMGR